jgi:acetyltransferase-like isoleucine patch superfamily enzyme
MTDGPRPDEASRRTPDSHRSSLARVALRMAHLLALPVSGAHRRLRRQRLVLGVRVRAVWHRARVDCDVAPDVRLGRRVRCTVVPRTTSTLRIGARCTVGDDVRLELRGGELVLGDDVEIRHSCDFGVGGRVELQGRNLIQHGCTVHCDEAIVVGPFSSVAEYVSIIDSSHVFDGPSEWWLDDVRTSPVSIGAHVWVGTKATIARGVRLGDSSIVSANSLAVKDVPAGYMASGVPARAVRAVHAGGAVGDVRAERGGIEPASSSPEGALSGAPSG